MLQFVVFLKRLNRVILNCLPAKIAHPRKLPEQDYMSQMSVDHNNLSVQTYVDPETSILLTLDDLLV